MKEKVFKYGFYLLFFIYSISISLSYNISNGVLALLLVLFLIYLVFERKFFKSKIYIPILLLLISFLISSFTGYDVKTALREITLFKGFLIMIIAMNVFPKEKKFFEVCLFLFFSGVLINAGYSIFEKLKYENPVYRVEALWGHYQFFSNFLIIAFFTELFYFTFTDKRWIKLLIFLLSILTFFSLILTGSRAQIIFTIMGFFAFLIFYRNRFAIVSSLFVLLIVVVSFLKVPVFYKRIKPMFFKNEKFGFYISDISEWEKRVDTWKMGFEVLKTKHKFFGVGLGNVKKFVNKELKINMRLPNLHNSFLEILASFGIFGFIVFLYFLFIYFYEIKKSIFYFREDKLYFYGISVFISSFIIFLLVGFLNDTFWNKRVMMQLLYFTGILFAFKRDEDTLSI